VSTVPVSPFGPAAPVSPFGPGAPAGSVPGRKSVGSSDPFRIFALVTALLARSDVRTAPALSCPGPTLFLGSAAAYEVPPTAMNSASRPT
jgi:hypothetical protein